MNYLEALKRIKHIIIYKKLENTISFGDTFECAGLGFCEDVYKEEINSIEQVLKVFELFKKCFVFKVKQGDDVKRVEHEDGSFEISRAVEFYIDEDEEAKTKLKEFLLQDIDNSLNK